MTDNSKEIRRIRAEADKLEKENDARRATLIVADEAEQMGEIIKATLEKLELKIPELASTIITEATTEAEIIAALHSIIIDVLAEGSTLGDQARAPRSTPSTPGEITIEELSEQTGIMVPVLIQAASVVLGRDIENIDADTVVFTERTPARFDSEAEGIRKLGEIAAAAYKVLDPRLGAT